MEEKDPLDKIFMDTPEKKNWFDAGRSNMARELKRNNQLEKNKLLKDNVFRALSGEVTDLKYSIRAVEKAVKYWKNRASRFENKGLAILKEIDKLNIPEKQKRKIINIFSSSSREWAKQRSVKSND